MKKTSRWWMRVSTRSAGTLDRCVRVRMQRAATHSLHRRCRGCMREYITGKLRDRRFPIICPLCAIDSARDNPGSACSIFFDVY